MRDERRLKPVGSASLIVQKSHRINTEGHSQPFFSSAFHNGLSYENSKMTKAPIRLRAAAFLLPAFESCSVRVTELPFKQPACALQSRKNGYRRLDAANVVALEKNSRDPKIHNVNICMSFESFTAKVD